MVFGPAGSSAKLGSEECMTSSKGTWGRIPRGALRVGSLGVSLDSVVIAFERGHSAETIHQLRI
jgi:hypothetical protein